MALSKDEIKQLLVTGAEQRGLPPDWALRVATQESGLNPNAVNKASGAAGLMQLMAPTAKEVGVTNRLDPVQSINGGLDYMKTLYDKYKGDLSHASAAYNWGMGNVDKFLSGKKSTMPAETVNYVAKVAGASPTAVTLADTPARQMGLLDTTSFDRSRATKDYLKMATDANKQLSADNTKLAALNTNTASVLGTATPTAMTNRLYELAQAKSDSLDASKQYYDKAMSPNTSGLGRLYNNFLGDTANVFSTSGYNNLLQQQNADLNTLADTTKKFYDVNQGMVANPNVQDKVVGNYLSTAGTGINQQQANTQAANVASDAQFRRDQISINQQQADTARMNAGTKAAVAGINADGSVDAVQQGIIAQSADLLGITLPPYKNIAQLKTALSKGKDASTFNTLMDVASRGGAALADNPYQATQSVLATPNAPLDVQLAAQAHNAFQQDLLKTLIPVTADPRTALVATSSDAEKAAAQAKYDQLARIKIAQAYQEAAAGTNPAINAMSSNPYSGSYKKATDVQVLANGVPLPKGIAPEDLKAKAVEVIPKMQQAGNTVEDIARFYAQLATVKSSNNSNKFGLFGAPEPTVGKARFNIQLAGTDLNLNLATPQGVSAYLAYLKAEDVGIFGRTLLGDRALREQGRPQPSFLTPSTEGFETQFADTINK